MSKLVPTVVLDKNGKTTTVYKLPQEGARKGLRSLFSAAPNSEPMRRDLLKATMAEVTELTGTTQIIDKAFTSIRTESLHGVLEILSHEESQPETAFIFLDRYDQSESRNTYNDWVSEYVSRYREVKSWDCGQSSGANDDSVAKLVTGMMYLQSKGVSVQESENMMRLTCALLGTGMAGGLHHRATPYGLSWSIRDEFISGFVARHPDSEEIEKACDLIVSGKLNRLEDLDDVLSGDVPTSIAEGIL